MNKITIIFSLQNIIFLNKINSIFILCFIRKKHFDLILLALYLYRRKISNVISKFISHYLKMFVNESSSLFLSIFSSSSILILIFFWNNTPTFFTAENPFRVINRFNSKMNFAWFLTNMTNFSPNHLSVLFSFFSLMIETSKH